MSLLERLNRKNKKYIAMQQAGQRSKNTHGATGFATSVDEAREASYQAIKSEIHTHIIDEMPDDLQRVINQSSSDQKELRRIVEGICADAIKDNPFAIPLGDRERLVEELISEILGLGPIEPLLKDSSVTEAMVNRPDSI